MSISKDDLRAAAESLCKKTEGTDFEHFAFLKIPGRRERRHRGGWTEKTDPLVDTDGITDALRLSNIQKGEYVRSGHSGTAGIAFRTLSDAMHFRLSYRGRADVVFIARWDYLLGQHEESVRQFEETAQLHRDWYARAAKDLADAEDRLAAAKAAMEKVRLTRASS